MINVQEAWNLAIAIAAFVLLVVTINKADNRTHQKTLEIDSKINLLFQRKQWEQERWDTRFSRLEEKLDRQR
ncbi:hypothetical protein [Nodularia sphaerocarpa]|uniref:hypothetical protein n=1 Tax=Nodularia sphaerocarpa TaxID=137816 RepID=UPI001EFA540C|nr:hypothetical protein [Nodularia sphaerocarpa]MDB9375759.1 hypothetical protein [Nodularia sphaerocarpa CS-585]ULP73098.1 hypothetical protein BDGGKGIB_02751 [Nodularia sphaerocarpa UHCC 0038]